MAAENQEFLYRLSTATEWAELQTTGETLGGDLDRRTGCIHLSNLNQVRLVLDRFYKGREDLFLVQIKTSELGDGLIYESADGSTFPHFYGPSRSFIPLRLGMVTKAEKLELVNGEFTCSLLNQAGT